MNNNSNQYFYFGLGIGLGIGLSLGLGICWKSNKVLISKLETINIPETQTKPDQNSIQTQTITIQTQPAQTQTIQSIQPTQSNSIQTQTQITADEQADSDYEKIDESYDMIPCSNIKKRTKDFGFNFFSKF